MMTFPSRLYVLSEDDVHSLSRTIRSEHNRPINRRVYDHPEPLPETPDVYVAAVPSGGIPPRSGGTPGSASCDIYKIGSSGLEQIGNFQQTLYNLSTSQIAPEVGFVAAIRDKFGRWLALGNEANVPQFIEFTLTGPPATSPTSIPNAVVTASWGKGAPVVTTPIVVYDDQQLFDDAIAGCKGMAVNAGTPLNELDWHFKIVRCQRLVHKIWGKVGASNMCGEAVVDGLIEEIEPIPFGECSYWDASVPVRLINTLFHYGEETDYVVLHRIKQIDSGENAGKWEFEVIDVERHKVKIALADTLRVKADKTALEWKTAEIAVETCNTTAEYEDAIALVQRPYAYGGNYIDHKLQLNMEKVLHFGNESDTPVDLLTMTEKKVVVSNQVVAPNLQYIAASIWIPEAAANDPATTFHTGTNVCPP